MRTTPVQKEIARILADQRRARLLGDLSLCWLGLLILLAAVFVLGRFAPVPAWLDWPVLAGLAGLSILVCLVRHSRQSTDLRDVARQIEQDDPKLNSLLLAALEQNPDPGTGQWSFLQLRVLREATEANRRSPWSRQAARRLFRMELAHLGLLSLVIAGLFILAVVEPKVSVAAAANDEGPSVTPGNAEVERGSAVAVVAKFGALPAGDVRLVYRGPDGSERRETMTRSLQDPLFGATLAEVNQDTSYSIVWEDGRSEKFQLKVYEHPELKRADADLEYPAYTRMAPAKVEDTRRVTAVEGTRTRLSLNLNKPVSTARLTGPAGSELVLTQALAGPNVYVAEFTIETNRQLRLELIDADGRTNKHAVDFVLMALPNKPPELKLIAPRGDTRVSALQEVAFEGKANDDFGLAAYGIGYSVNGAKPEEIPLSGHAPAAPEPASATPSTAVARTGPHEKRDLAWMLALENLKVQPDELITYYLWAEDVGPDGQLRRTTSDLYFAEVRPFEEVFRQGPSGGEGGAPSAAGGGGQENPATKLVELQKEIVQATWNLRRKETGEKMSRGFKDDAKVVRDSQSAALDQGEELKGELADEKSQAIATSALKSMETALNQLDEAVSGNSSEPLPAAIEAEQAAYQSLLRLQARVYQVSRNRNSSSSGGRGQQRAQRQLDQLELKEEENRYETQSQASLAQNEEQRENLQVLSRLKELARRQQDVSEQLKELQTALNEARTEEEKKELERRLKRLEEEQQQIVQDMDELNQRMSQEENRSRMAEARQQLDQARQETRQSAQEMQEGQTGQALSSSTRAQQQLQNLSEEFRRSTARQFSEEMSQLRQQSRELKDTQERVMEQMGGTERNQRRTLSDESEQGDLAAQLAQQRSALTNLLQNVRQVTEASEVAEPLLSRQLYDSMRKVTQADTEKNLELAAQRLQRNLASRAAEPAEKARAAIEDLNAGIERAAESVLGDEAASLRLAQKELEELRRRVEQEMQAAVGAANRTNLARAGGAGESGESRGGEQAAAGEGQPGEGQPGERPGERSGEASANRAGQQPGGQPSDRPGDQPGNQPGGTGQRSAAVASAQGQGPGQASGTEPSGEQGQPNESGQPSPSGQQPGGGAGGGGQSSETAQAQRGGPQEGSPNAPNQGGRDLNWARGGGGSGGGGNEGPLTGRDFRGWSDRLREVEELVQNPVLRGDVSRIRDRAREMRTEITRHAATPQWDLVDESIVKPLRIVQRRLAEELARHASKDAMVPVDRDPVPKRYAEAVNAYYERLGKD